MVADDPAVWDIYAKGLTIGVNQCEKPATMEKLKRYKPRNVSELAAFIAAIRPGFKSMYQRFESREPFSYGIPTLDKLIQTKEIPNSYILFQENLMTILNYASFAMSETYQAVKDIAKKKADKVKALKDKFEEGCTEQIVKDEGISTEEALEISTKIWKIINDSSSYIFNACLAGDTVMFRNYTGYKPITIEEMYQINHDIVYAIKTDHKDLHYKYVNYGYGTAYSMRPDENNLIKRNQIVDIRPAGERETYRLTLESGISVVATMNHKFPTPNGELHLSELKIGDSLYVKDKYKKDKFDATLNKVPRDGGYTIFESFRKKCREEQHCCDICGKPYSKDTRFEIHHIDGDRKHNEFSNYQWLCVSCHKKIHYREFGRTVQGGKGYTTHLEKIVSIEFEKTQMTYDVEMAAPYHNFVLDNGMVVSNSHAYCMALDSLYCAYLKAHYPYEFYEVLLQFYSDKGNKDKVRLIKQEMKAFGIEEGSYRFGLDNRKFKADPEHHQIVPSLLSIKALSQKCANIMYQLGQEEFPDFLHLYRRAQKEGINSKQLDILIKIGYFEDFGTQKQLDAMITAYETLGWGERQSVDLDKLPDWMQLIVRGYTDEKGNFLSLGEDISELRQERDMALDQIVCTMKERYKTKKASLELIKSNADLPEVHAYQETKALYETRINDAKKRISDNAKQTSLKCLLDLCDWIRDTRADYSTVEKIQREFKCLGYLATDYSKANPDFVLVSKIDDKYATRKVTVYRVCDGEETLYKVFSRTWEELPLEKGDLVRLLDTRQDFKRMKDETGKWTPTKEKEWILSRYNKFQKNLQKGVDK